MIIRSGRRLVLSALLLFAVWSCGRGGKSEGGASRQAAARPPLGASRTVSHDAPVAYVDSTLEFPRISFCDSQISLNDRCIVRQAKLNLRMPPIYVNGHPIGFC